MNETQFAKKHIRNRFSLMVLPHVNEGLLSVYENARAVCEKNRQVDQTLKTFQNLLTFIPKWDEDRLNTEVQRIQTASGCTYLEEMLTGVLITYLRAFASIQYVQDNIEVEFERPPLPRFIHELYKECARQCWQHAYLYKTYQTSMEQQARNRKELEGILEVALDTTLDSFLPWKSIVEKYFKEPAPNPIVATEMSEETPRVKFEDDDAESSSSEEEEEEEDTNAGPPLTLSDEMMELDVESLDEKKEEKKEDAEVDLTPNGEQLVLNL
jgi:hypothetical protein